MYHEILYAFIKITILRNKIITFKTVTEYRRKMIHRASILSIINYKKYLKNLKIIYLTIIDYIIFKLLRYFFLLFKDFGNANFCFEMRPSLPFYRKLFNGQFFENVDVST